MRSTERAKDLEQAKERGALRFLGRGSYQEVFVAPWNSANVVKRCRDRMSAKYLLSFSRNLNSTGSRIVPVVHAYHGRVNGAWWIETERLFPIEDRTLELRIKRADSDAACAKFSRRAYKAYCETMIQALPYELEGLEGVTLDELDLAVTLRALCRFLSRHKNAGALDCHEDNWMQRANGELVLNDPVAFSGYAPFTVRPNV